MMSNYDFTRLNLILFERMNIFFTKLFKWRKCLNNVCQLRYYENVRFKPMYVAENTIRTNSLEVVRILWDKSQDNFWLVLMNQYTP